MESLFGKSTKSVDHESSEHWISVSDLMSGLMMVFLFISIALMRNALIERDKIKHVAVAYQNSKVALHEKLKEEFKNDLQRWDAEIDKDTLSFQFKSPDLLFGVGSSEITPKFKLVLNDFFPRYMHVMNGFRNSITEIRIEGHTSSLWSIGTSTEDAYFKNMALSQERTRSVLFFVQSLPQIYADQAWVRRNIAAVGLSSSHIVTDDKGNEDAERSRRVTFRVITNAETQIRRLTQE